MLGLGDAPELFGSGEAPHPAIVEHIVRLVAQRYPNGGNQLCAAASMAVELAWNARHELGTIVRASGDGQVAE